MKLIKVIVTTVLIVVGVFVLINRSANSKMVSPQNNFSSQVVTTPTPSPTPTPVPVIINQSSNLETEMENLTPEDFSGDFKILKEEAGEL